MASVARMGGLPVSLALAMCPCSSPCLGVESLSLAWPCDLSQKNPPHTLSPLLCHENKTLKEDEDTRKEASLAQPFQLRSHSGMCLAHP